MPISIQNKILHIWFLIGLSNCQVSLLGLYETGSVVTTGLYLYHKSLCNCQSNLVHFFEEFDRANLFDPIKHKGAITHPSAYNEQQQSKISAVIYFHSPFSYEN